MLINLVIGSFALLFALGTPVTETAPGVETIIGKWIAKAQTPNGPLDLEFDIKMEGTQLVGSMAGFQGSVPLNNLKFEEPDLSLEMALGGMNFKLTGVLNQGKFSGKWAQAGGDMQGTWTAERKAVPAPGLSAGGISGSWDSVAVTPNGNLAATLELKEDGDKISGTVGSPMGTIPIQAASFKDSKLQFDVPTANNTYRIEATLKEGKFAGQWSAVGGTATGAWSATRKAAPPATAEPTSLLDGTWNAVAVTPDGSLPFQVSMKLSGEAVSGNVVTAEGNIPLQRAKFVNNALTFEIDYAGATYRIEATLGDGKLTGKWLAVGAQETGAWSAERKTP